MECLSYHYLHIIWGTLCRLIYDAEGIIHHIGITPAMKWVSDWWYAGQHKKQCETKFLFFRKIKWTNNLKINWTEVRWYDSIAFGSSKVFKTKLSRRNDVNRILPTMYETCSYERLRLEILRGHRVGHGLLGVCRRWTVLLSLLIAWHSTADFWCGEIVGGI